MDLTRLRDAVSPTRRMQLSSTVRKSREAQGVPVPSLPDIQSRFYPWKRAAPVRKNSRTSLRVELGDGVRAWDLAGVYGESGL